ncbi:MAG: hypothetical protein HOL85_20370 [Rhodospirillaceae bacterium]|nr:hypothetical protein [Rhodospirillaceae bacterium]MBT6138023.1 hypothetical protein [Rhodospirillaceae bacterium]
MTTRDPLLASFLGHLLPGDHNGWPTASTLHLARRFREHVTRTPDGTSALALILDHLGDGFMKRAPDDANALLLKFEEEAPDEFERLVVAAYSVYYTDPGVLAAVERLTGYEARPPQPLGHELEPFDEALLANVRRREPFWRRINDILPSDRE